MLCKYNGEAEDRQSYKEILLEGLPCHTSRWIFQQLARLSPYSSILNVS